MKLLMIAVLSLSTSAFASSFDGVWSGVGFFHLSSWGKFENAPVTITIQESDSILSVNTCWQLKNTRSCEGASYEIQGTTLSYQGYPVGTLSPSQISLSFSAGYLNKVVFTLDNGVLDFNDIYQTPTSFKKAQAQLNRL